MSVTDPIADMLTRIRNALQSKKETVVVPGSNIKREILQRLLDEGFIAEVVSEEDGKQGILTARLKYDENGDPVIDGLKRLSKQGRRVYVRSTEIPKERNGYGVVILSTSRGVLTDTEARKQGLGGELLCSIW